MTNEAVETIMEVVDDEIKNKFISEQLDILSRLRDTLDIVINGLIEDNI